MARLALVVLLLALAAVAMGFVLPTPTTDRAVKTRVHSWFGGKKAKKEPPAAPPAKAASTQKSGMRAFSKKPEEMKGNKRPTAMDYRGMVVSKDEDVIVPATEYFAQKNDPIVPILFAGLFIPIFGLLGWWLFSPTPEPVIEDQNTKVSYDQYVNQGKAKARRF